MQHNPDLTVTRVRHPLKFRLLQVVRIHAVTPHLLRVTLSGPDLADFESASFDDHVKVFLPPPGTERPTLPSVGPDGPVFPDGEPKPVARDFTPRRFDRTKCELDLEFVLNHPGPASQWAAQARVGQWLGIGGPRGSFVVPTGFDWHLLIGDDTALPAVARRLEELPPRARARRSCWKSRTAARKSRSTRARKSMRSGVSATKRRRAAATRCWTPSATCRCRLAMATCGRPAKRSRCARCGSI